MVLYIHHDDGENIVNHVTPFLSCLFKLVLFSVLFVHFLCYCCFNFRKKSFKNRFKKHSCALKKQQKKLVLWSCSTHMVSASSRTHPCLKIFCVNARLKRNCKNTSSVKEIKNEMQRTRVKSFSIIPTPFTIFELDLHFDVCFAPVKFCDRLRHKQPLFPQMPLASVSRHSPTYKDRPTFRLWWIWHVNSTIKVRQKVKCTAFLCVCPQSAEVDYTTTLYNNLNLQCSYTCSAGGKWASTLCSFAVITH